MLWFYEHLELVVLGIFATGVTLHFAVRRMERQTYLELRAAYEGAVRESRKRNGAPAAVVREAELHRAFMNSWLPGWFDGFGRCVSRWLKVCAVFTLAAFFFRGPIMRGEDEFAKRQARREMAQPTDRPARRSPALPESLPNNATSQERSTSRQAVRGSAP